LIIEFIASDLKGIICYSGNQFISHTYRKW